MGGRRGCLACEGRGLGQGPGDTGRFWTGQQVLDGEDGSCRDVGGDDTGEQAGRTRKPVRGSRVASAIVVGDPTGTP